MPGHVIDAVIFDFGNVICSFDIQLFRARIARRSNRSPAELLASLPAINRLAVEYETGSISSDMFLARLCAATGITVGREEFIEDYTTIFTPVQETYDLVRELKPRYKLGLLSNTNEWHFQYSIRPVEIFPLFDAVTLSFEVKAMKPAAALYEDMLGKLRVPASRCAYIDDLRENVDAAGMMGMHAIHYTGPAQLRRSLVKLGVLLK